MNPSFLFFFFVPSGPSDGLQPTSKEALLKILEHGDLLYIYIYVSKGFPRKKTDSEKEAVGKRAGPPNTSHVFLCGMMFKTGSFQIPCW